MVSMSMRDYDKIELGEIDTFGLYVMGKDVSISPVSNRMRLPWYSMRAENPQSFFKSDFWPKASYKIVIPSVAWLEAEDSAALLEFIVEQPTVSVMARIINVEIKQVDFIFLSNLHKSSRLDFTTS